MNARFLPSRSTQAGEGSRQFRPFQDMIRTKAGGGGHHRGEFGYSWALTDTSASLLPKPAGWAPHSPPSIPTAALPILPRAHFVGTLLAPKVPHPRS